MDAIATPRLNSQITAPEVRVLDEKGASVGVMSRDEALALAQEKGVDLVEVVSHATPPIVRVISYDKYRYQKEKEAKRERQAQKTAGLKQIQISARSASNDLMVKVRQLEKFLQEGHEIEIQLRLRGREKYNRPWAHEKLSGFLTMIPVEYKVLSPAKFGGKGLGIHITKK